MEIVLTGTKRHKHCYSWTFCIVLFIAGTQLLWKHQPSKYLVSVVALFVIADNDVCKFAEPSIAAVVPREKGGLMLAGGSHFSIFLEETKEFYRVKAKDGDLFRNHFKHGKCDFKGRFWAGQWHKFEINLLLSDMCRAVQGFLRWPQKSTCDFIQCLKLALNLGV